MMSNDNKVQAQILSNEKSPPSNRNYSDTEFTNSSKHCYERDFNNNHVTPQSTTLNDNLEDFTDQETTLPDLNYQLDDEHSVSPDTLVTLKLIDLKILKEQRYLLLDKYKKVRLKYKNNKREMKNYNSLVDAIPQQFDCLQKVILEAETISGRDDTGSKVSDLAKIAMTIRTLSNGISRILPKKSTEQNKNHDGNQGIDTSNYLESSLKIIAEFLSKQTLDLFSFEKTQRDQAKNNKLASELKLKDNEVQMLHRKIGILKQEQGENDKRHQLHIASMEEKQKVQGGFARMARKWPKTA